MLKDYVLEDDCGQVDNTNPNVLSFKSKDKSSNQSDCQSSRSSFQMHMINPNRIDQNTILSERTNRRKQVKAITNHFDFCIYQNYEKDTNSQIIDWCKNDVLGVGLENVVFLLDPFEGMHKTLCNVDSTKPFGDTQGKVVLKSLKWMHCSEKYIALGLSDSTIQIYDSVKQNLFRVLRSHKKDVTCLDWNGHMLTSGSKDGSVISHDIRAKQNVVNIIDTQAGEILDLDWDMTGKYLATGSYGSKINNAELNIWDIRRLNCNHNNPEDNIDYTPIYSTISKKSNNVKWNPHSYNILSASTGNKINLYNGPNGVQLSNHRSSSDLFKDDYITKLLWDQVSDSLLVSTEFLNYSNDFESDHGSISKFKVNITCENYSSRCQLEKTHSLVGSKYAATHLCINPDGAEMIALCTDNTMKSWSLHSYDKVNLQSDSSIFRKKQDYSPMKEKDKSRSSFGFNQLRENCAGIFSSLR